MSNDFKVGRNDLCGCGSGKKYKKCCLPSSDKTLDFSWRKIRQTEGELIDKHLLPYVRTHLPRHTLETAFADLLQDIEVSEDEHDMIFDTMFIPWFVFNWIPHSEDISEKEIAVQYLEYRNYTLSPYQKKMMEAYCNSYFSFYVVLDVVFEESLHLKDIFLDSEHTIKENQATHYLTKGQIIFTRLVTVDDQSIGSGIFPYVISPDHHVRLIDLRDSLKKQVKRKTLTPSIMRNYDNELRLFCLRVALPSRKAAPEIRNTNNERLQFCTVHFKSSLRPQETLKKLMPLVFNENYKSLLKYAGKDASGKISRIEFSWNKPGNAKIKEWSNTILGHVEIIGDKIIIRVNSQERGERIRGLVADLLGEEGVYQNTVMENMDHLVSSEASPSSQNPSLNDLPEIQEYLKEMSQKHWQGWLDESLPALDDITPREAVRTSKGKEKVEALFLMFEAHNARKPGDPMNTDIPYLKKALGLS